MFQNQLKIWEQSLEESLAIRQALISDDDFKDSFSKACELLLTCRIAGGTIYMAGNGGSACDAMHFYEELVGRYSKERVGIKAQHLMDAGYLTCWTNDYNYETVFSRQIETHCESKDLLIVLTTSGNSANILKAIQAAKAKNVPVVLLTGKDGGKAKQVASVSLVVPAERTDRIQEVHITLIHSFCEFLEQDL